MILSFNGGKCFELEESESSYIFKLCQVNDDLKEQDVFKVESLPEYLNNEFKTIVVDSIKSGKGRTDSKNLYAHIIKPLFEELSIQHQYLSTESEISITQFSKNLISGTKYTLIFLSGDTSISEFINGLDLEADVAISILNLPMGTGNAFCHSLGLHTVLEGLRKLFLGSTKPFNIFNATFSEDSFLIQNGNRTSIDSMRFFVVGSWALHASLVADSDTPEMRKFGSDRFKMAAENLLTINPPFHGTSYIRDKLSGSLVKKLEGPFSYFVAAALPRFEEKFVISPDSKPAEASLHILSFNHQTSETTMKIMGQAYDNGAHISNPVVNYTKVGSNERIELVVEENEDSLSRVCIDGSIILLIAKERKSMILESITGHDRLRYIS